MAKKTETIKTEIKTTTEQTDAKNKNGKNKQPTKYHVVIFHQQRDDIFDRALVGKIQSLLDEKITTPPESTHIDVWLESPGGSADAAYKLVLDLRSRCSRLWTVVPDYAKSAATLMALGADCIFMAPAAELGPLDVQIQHPDRENIYVSGLDVTNSLEYLTTTALHLALVGGASVLKYTGMPRKEVLHELLQFMAQFMEPAISKLDPHIIHKATNELKVAEEYALRMLSMRKLDQNNQLTKKDAKDLLGRLVKDYPTHGFIISRAEAKSLGLPVKCAVQDYSRWQHVKALYAISYEKVRTIVDVFLDSELDQEPVNNEEGNNATCSQNKTKSQ